MVWTDNKIEAVFIVLKEGKRHLQTHEMLMEQPIIIQYYFIKAFRETENASVIYHEFASESKQSKHGPKAIFHNILKDLYVFDDKFDKRRDELAKMDELQSYIDIANKVFK